MFGYIKPLTSELRVKDYETYKAVYCGLCRQMSRSFGPLARFNLSYDFTLLAMVGMEFEDEMPSYSAASCPARPFKKCTAAEESPALRRAADCAAVLLYYKLLDNLEDKGFKNRLAARLLLPFAKRARKKAMLSCPQAEQAARTLHEKQREAEASGTDSFDRAAEPTAEALSAIAALFANSEENSRILEHFGYMLGRYIYLCDALDDVYDDFAKQNYNPIIARAAVECPTESERSAAIEKLREQLKFSVNATAAQAASTYSLAAAPKFGAITENILCLGLAAVAEEIYSKGGDRR